MSGYNVDRRKFLALIGSLPLAYSCFGAAQLGAQSSVTASSAASTIDVHCHVFNASDLPIHGFLQRIVFGDEEDQVIFDPDGSRARALFPWLGATLVNMFVSAPDADAELAYLRDQPRALSGSSTGRDSKEGQERLRRALEQTFSENVQPTGRARRKFLEQQNKAGRDLFLEKILEEVGPDPTLNALRASQKPFEPLARGLLSGKGPISHHIQWADLLTSYRSEITKKIIDTYGEVALFVPALVDFSGWLDEEPNTPIGKQIEIMERIQRLELGAAVHCMAPFNPWRQVLDEAAGRTPTALQLVDTAVMELGFLGVKLYPPMGFLPIGNAGSGISYPERAADIPNFPTRIDQALEALYAWAETHSVPIMAHATNSNGAADDYSLRAHPKGWADVFKKYPSLRLNLAHFGGFDEVRRPGNLDDTWELSIGYLLKSGASDIYADLSYLHEFLPGIGEPDQLELIRSNLALFIDRFDPSLEKLMYGSDWSMIGREKAHEQYFAVIQRLVRALGVSDRLQRQFFSENASRFLGLNEGGAARARLVDYYRRNQLDPEWLQQFGTVQ